MDKQEQFQNIIIEATILTAEIVYSIVTKMLLIKKFPHVSDGITVQSLTPTWRERHSDNSIRYVCQVQVKTVIDVATLILRNLQRKDIEKERGWALASEDFISILLHLIPKEPCDSFVLIHYSSPEKDTNETSNDKESYWPE